MRSALKAIVESVALRAGPAGLARACRRGRALVLAYHNVLPDGEEPGSDRSLHLPQRRFAEQLERLAQFHEVVPLDEVLAAPARTASRPRAAITLDDAYRGAVTVGVEELARRGLPATLFVAPGFVGGRTFWWDAVPAAAVDPAVRDRLLREHAGRDEAVRAWARERGEAILDVPAHAGVASEEELAAAVRHAGISLGAHSWSHPNLAALEGDELRAELERPLEWLRARFREVVPWLAYPYGLHGPHVEAAAAAAGYRGALRVSGGWLPRSRLEPFALPRFNVPAGLSADGFALRTAGLFCR